MKLIYNWRKCYRMISVQAMGLASAIQASWLFIPEDMKASISPQYVQYVTIGLLVFGIFGRLVDQPKTKV